MQKNFGYLMIGLLVLGACSKQDPILPGERQPIFRNSEIVVLNTEVLNLPDTAYEPVSQDCPYTQDSSNTIYNGDKKIFTGFPTPNFVGGTLKPVCSGKFVYAGLSTGELVKVNGANRQIAWIVDLYKSSTVTGGTNVLDVVAPAVIRDTEVYAGGIGENFCRIKNSNGTKEWCVDIGIGVSFVIAGNAVFAVSTDNYLYAINTTNGEVYWRADVKKQIAPVYENQIIRVGKQKFDAKSGNKI